MKNLLQGHNTLNAAQAGVPSHQLAALALVQTLNSSKCIFEMPPILVKTVVLLLMSFLSGSLSESILRSQSKTPSQPDSHATISEEL